jgi:hypothetical protein
MTPSQPEYTKIPPKTGRYLCCLIEKSPKTKFLIKTLTRYTSITYYEK